jgi:hypothetical protein
VAAGGLSEGAEIPVPKRKDFYANLDKMVKAHEPAKKPGAKN